MKVEMDGEVFISRQSRHFSFVDNMIKLLFPICTLNWRLNNHVSRQGKDKDRRNESAIIIGQICSFWYCTKRKLAAVLRETPENTRIGQSQKTLDPGIA